MKKLQILGLLRNLLIAASTAFGIYADKVGMELPFDATMATTLFSVIVIAWGIWDKTLRGANYWTSLLRSVIAVAGGLMLGFGVSAEIVELLPIIGGVLVSLIAMGSSASVNGSIAKQIAEIEAKNAAK